MYAGPESRLSMFFIVLGRPAEELLRLRMRGVADVHAMALGRKARVRQLRGG